MASDVATTTTTFPRDFPLRRRHCGRWKRGRGLLLDYNANSSTPGRKPSTLSNWELLRTKRRWTVALNEASRSTNPSTTCEWSTLFFNLLLYIVVLVSVRHRVHCSVVCVRVQRFLRKSALREHNSSQGQSHVEINTCLSIHTACIQGIYLHLHNQITIGHGLFTHLQYCAFAT